MYPSNFDYHRPSTLEEAAALLQADGEARILAGGHSLLPAMKLRLATPTALVDLAAVPGICGIAAAAEGASLTIGALTTHGEVASSPLVESSCPLLAETATHIGDLQVRNRGTIGGSLAHADPGADYPTALLALDATVETGGAQSRQIPSRTSSAGCSRRTCSAARSSPLCACRPTAPAREARTSSTVTRRRASPSSASPRW